MYIVHHILCACTTNSLYFVHCLLCSGTPNLVYLYAVYSYVVLPVLCNFILHVMCTMYIMFCVHVNHTSMYTYSDLMYIFVVCNCFSSCMCPQVICLCTTAQALAQATHTLIPWHWLATISDRRVSVALSSEIRPLRM